MSSLECGRLKPSFSKASDVSTEQPIEPKFHEMMNALAGALEKILNPDGVRRNGFVLLSFEFGATEGGRVNYISNAERPEMLNAMKEFIARAEGRIKDDEHLQ